MSGIVWFLVGYVVGIISVLTLLWLLIGIKVRDGKDIVISKSAR